MWCASMFALQNSTVPSSVFTPFVLWWMVWLKVLIDYGGKAAENRNSWSFLIFFLEWLLSSSFLLFTFCACTPEQRQAASIRVSKGYIFLHVLCWFTHFCGFSGQLSIVSSENVAPFPNTLVTAQLNTAEGRVCTRATCAVCWLARLIGREIQLTRTFNR